MDRDKLDRVALILAKLLTIGHRLQVDNGTLCPHGRRGLEIEQLACEGLDELADETEHLDSVVAAVVAALTTAFCFLLMHWCGVWP